MFRMNRSPLPTARRRNCQSASAKQVLNCHAPLVSLSPAIICDHLAIGVGDRDDPTESAPIRGQREIRVNKVNIRARLTDLERRLIPSEDQLLLGTLITALDGTPDSRQKLKDFLAGYNPGGSRLHEVAEIFLAGPAAKEKSDLLEEIQ